ncbi:Hypothetical predicted protein [Mytilus galloprovincialis]|uniref:C-type lectin domain-containing protein n=1 Tax=Mytilus galloprovincialis TaxID=29158 RepID=A0A8B6GR38_MYTGA|nr:Hypothetical predicted protein [Mytilus galloprovincialis]
MHIVSVDAWWIGLTDIKTEGSFKWDSGHPLSFTDWYQGPPSSEPDDLGILGNTNDVDCAHLSARLLFQWQDEDCVRDLSNHALCEFRYAFICPNKIRLLQF